MLEEISIGVQRPEFADLENHSPLIEIGDWGMPTRIFWIAVVAAGVAFKQNLYWTAGVLVVLGVAACLGIGWRRNRAWIWIFHEGILVTQEVNPFKKDRHWYQLPWGSIEYIDLRGNRFGIGYRGTRLSEGTHFFKPISAAMRANVLSNLTVLKRSGGIPGTVGILER